MLDVRALAPMRLGTALVCSCGLLAALATACVPAPTPASASAPSSAPASAPNAVASPVPSPAPALSAAANSGPASASAASALPPASIEVSPAQVQLGGLTLSLVVEPARHMQDPSTPKAADPDPAHQPDTGAASAPAAGATVLDGLLRVTNNLDPSQPAPADLPQAIVRHAAVHVRTADAGYAVPYLSVSMDMLLDGRPTTSGQALVPMVAAEATAPELYYGNNIKLTQRGNYQVFVRIQRSALLGKDQPQAAQFDLDVR